MKKMYRVLIRVYEEDEFIKVVDKFEAESEEEALRLAEEDYPGSKYQILDK